MNPYYTRSNTFTPYSVARGDAVTAEFDDVVVGFDRLDVVNVAFNVRIEQLELPTIAVPGNPLPALPLAGFWAVYATGTGLALAQADAENHLATAYVLGIDGDNLRVATAGVYQVAGHNLTPGATYFLDQGAPAVTSQRPTSGFSQPVCEAWVGGYINFFSHRPVLL